MKFTNTPKNNMQLGEKINGTKGTKQLQNKKTNTEHKTTCLSQLIYYPPLLLTKSNKKVNPVVTY